MLSNKKSVLQLVALLKSHGISSVVLCPGSRNIPIVHTIANCDCFTSYSVIDERSAGFFALGIALRERCPVAVVVTSGSALLNLHPAVSEAYYQQVPLVIISADRPQAWIGQMDGQTLPQANVFGNLVKMSIDLDEIHTSEDEWYCNRAINEALLSLDHHGRGPIHINVQISDPFFSFPVKELPSTRTIHRYNIDNFALFKAHIACTIGQAAMRAAGVKSDAGQEELVNEQRKLIDNSTVQTKLYTATHAVEEPYSYLQQAMRFAFGDSPNIMLVVGQDYEGVLASLSKEEFDTLCRHMLICAENIANVRNCAHYIDRVDALIAQLPNCPFKPDLIITLGGHIISKRLKRYIRSNKPRRHIHVASDGAIVDTFQCLSHVLEMEPITFLHLLVPVSKTTEVSAAKLESLRTIRALNRKLIEPNFEFSQMKAIGRVMQSIPSGSRLHLANSSTVRYAQLFKLKSDINVYANRGVNGIDGSLSSAIGYAAADATAARRGLERMRLNFIMIGDLSFFYDMNALWNSHVGDNVRILLLNNASGEIFHALPGLKLNDKSVQYVTAPHETSAQGWANTMGIEYLSAHNDEELEMAVERFSNFELSSDRPMLLEVFTDKMVDVELMKDFYTKQIDN